MAFLKFAVPVQGGNKDYEYDLTADEITIGREQDNDIVMMDEQVSRHHAKIISTAKGYMLLDNGSANGTYIQNKKIQYHLLEQGDSFSIGSTSFSYFESKHSMPTVIKPKDKNPALQNASVQQNQPVVPHIDSTAQAAPQYPKPVMQLQMPQPSSSQPQVLCPFCMAIIPPDSTFCMQCGSALADGYHYPDAFEEKPKHRVGLIAFVLILVFGIGGGSIYLVRNWKRAKSLFSKPPAYAEIAPELLMYGDRAKLHSQPQAFSVDNNGGITTLADGARIEVAQGVLNAPTKFETAILDLDLPNISKDVSQARIYRISADTGNTQLSQPVVVNFPVASRNFTIAELHGSAWQPMQLTDIAAPQIYVDHFSGHDYSVISWNAQVAKSAPAQEESGTSAAGLPPVNTSSAGASGASSDTGMVPPGIQTSVLEPDNKEIALQYLFQFINWYSKQDFSQVIEMGNIQLIKEAMYKDLDITIDPNFEMTGKYFMNWIENNELKVQRLANDFDLLKAFYHEFFHHMVHIRGGEKCGPEETYAELLENRETWLSNLVPLDNYIRNIDKVTPESCTKIQQLWNNAASQWENYSGNHLSGPFKWTDPNKQSCKDQSSYTISKEYIDAWDKKLGINIDINRIRNFYKEKLGKLNFYGKFDGVSECDMRAMVPKPEATLAGMTVKPLEEKPTSGPSSVGPSEVTGQTQQCPPQIPRREKCPWSPNGYSVEPCPPGFCFDAGPQGALHCVQTKGPPNSGRNEGSSVVCGEGHTAIRDKCTNLITECK